MTNHPRRTEVARAKRAAIAAGYRLAEGEHPDGYLIVRPGSVPDTSDCAYARKGDAWIAAAEMAEQPA